MEEDKIKALFDDFSPDLSDSDRFMEQLERNMEAAEAVKEQISSAHHRSRRAAAVAAVAGFASGAATAMLASWMVPKLVSTIPAYQGFPNIYADSAIWLLTAAVALLTSMGTLRTLRVR